MFWQHQLELVRSKSEKVLSFLSIFRPLLSPRKILSRRRLQFGQNKVAYFTLCPRKPKSFCKPFRCVSPRMIPGDVKSKIDNASGNVLVRSPKLFVIFSSLRFPKRSFWRRLNAARQNQSTIIRWMSDKVYNFHELFRCFSPKMIPWTREMQLRQNQRRLSAPSPKKVINSRTFLKFSAMFLWTRRNQLWGR